MKLLAQNEYKNVSGGVLEDPEMWLRIAIDGAQSGAEYTYSYSMSAPMGDSYEYGGHVAATTAAPVDSNTGGGNIVTNWATGIVEL